jgi:hypothetical protein
MRADFFSESLVEWPERTIKLVEQVVAGDAVGSSAPPSALVPVRRTIHALPRIVRAAFQPAAPMTPPPGCAAAPHRNRPRMGVR